MHLSLDRIRFGRKQNLGRTRSMLIMYTQIEASCSQIVNMQKAFLHFLSNDFLELHYKVQKNTPLE
jgi:hypothetical protein